MNSKIQDTKVDDNKLDDLIKVLKLPYEVRNYQEII